MYSFYKKLINLKVNKYKTEDNFSEYNAEIFGQRNHK